MTAEPYRRFKFNLASHLHKTVYELNNALPIDEFCEWIAWFELKDSNATFSVNDSDANYAAIRNVLN